MQRWGGSPLSFAVAEAQVLCYQLCVGLNCVVVVFEAPGGAAGAEEGVMIHTGPPQVFTGFGTGQNQRHLTVLGLSLQHTFVVILHNASFRLCNFSCSGCICVWPILMFSMNDLLLVTHRIVSSNKSIVHKSPIYHNKKH